MSDAVVEGRLASMSRMTITDRKATAAEVTAQAARIRDLAHHFGLSGVRLRGDGTVVVHSAEPGYRLVTRFSEAASDVVGTYVYVITDDVPGAIDTQEL